MALFTARASAAATGILAEQMYFGASCMVWQQHANRGIPRSLQAKPMHPSLSVLAAATFSETLKEGSMSRKRLLSF